MNDLNNLQNEVWVPIYRHYAVSNMGRVKSFKGKQPRILKPADNGNGYDQVIFKLNGKRIPGPIHRLVALLFVKNTNPLRITVNHHKGKKDNRATSLSWMTFAENSQHGVATGLLKLGSQHHNSILDETQVLVIKSLYKQIKSKEIARYFKTCMSNISAICKGKRWGHIS